MFFIKPTLNGVTFDITLKNYGSKKKQFNLYTDIIDKETGAILYSVLYIRKLLINSGEEQGIPLSFKLYDSISFQFAPLGRRSKHYTESLQF